MSNPFIGEIRMFAGNFPPANWAFCNGALQSIANNSALFALIGTTYGGDGVNTFALPNLQSRVPMHFGQGPGLSNYVQGQTGGVENVTVTGAQLPIHNHPVQSLTSGGTVAAPASTAVLADMGPAGEARVGTYKPFDGTSQVTLAAQTVGQAGSNQPHTNIQPTLAVSFIISLFGVFPARN
jgi:microcystin-dependent protein